MLLHGLQLRIYEQSQPELSKLSIHDIIELRNPNDIMIQESSEVLGGNDQFEGFVPDMVNILSRILHFNYTLRIGANI